MTAAASAPASSANIGPGFDSVALALGLRCTVTAHPVDRWEVLSGGAPVDAQTMDFVLRAAAVADHPLRIEIESEIPRRAGLGSSAAVAVAIIAAASRAVGAEPGSAWLLRLASELEGHCDNAAAAIHGGLVAVAGGTVIPLELSPHLIPLVAVPSGELVTGEARRALPEAVPHALAARSVARAIALVEGLRTGDRRTLEAAAGDELHEAPRADLAPGTTRLVAVARDAGARHAGWSGAGPAVLAIVTEPEREAVAAALTAAMGGSGRVIAPEVDRLGWR